MALRDRYPNAVRAVFFETDYEGFEYATYGGTVFLVSVAGQTFAVTCRHVLGDFKASKIFITQKRFGEKGSKPAPVEDLIYPSKPTGHAQESDVLDMCAIRISKDLPPDFFPDPPYVLDESTIATSTPGDRLEVFGILNEKSEITSPDLIFSFGRLEFQDYGHYRSDPVLSEARAVFSNPGFKSVDGISGSPVFNVTKDRLCGMVVRGGMEGAACTIFYLDVQNIYQFLTAIMQRKEHVYYEQSAIVLMDARKPVHSALGRLRRRLLLGTA